MMPRQRVVIPHEVLSFPKPMGFSVGQALGILGILGIRLMHVVLFSQVIFKLDMKPGPNLEI